MSAELSFQTLQTAGGSAFVAVEFDVRTMERQVLSWREPGRLVQIVRGRKMRGVDELFDECAAALQFPWYFGENWPAFAECLSDMEWFNIAGGIVLVMTDPEQTLIDDPKDLPAFVRAVRNAAANYRAPIALGESWDRPAVPFRLVQAWAPGSLAQGARRWEAAGAQIDQLGSP